MCHCNYESLSRYRAYLFLNRDCYFEQYCDFNGLKLTVESKYGFV